MRNPKTLATSLKKQHKPFSKQWDNEHNEIKSAIVSAKNIIKALQINKTANASAIVYYRAVWRLLVRELGKLEFELEKQKKTKKSFIHKRKKGMATRHTDNPISEAVNNYPTKNKEGFTHSEIISLLKELKIKKRKFDKAMGTNTCMLIDGEVITYHIDIINALLQIVTNKPQHPLLWD